jgi:hypothetical protein
VTGWPKVSKVRLPSGASVQRAIGARVSGSEISTKPAAVELEEVEFAVLELSHGESMAGDCSVDQQ